MVSGDVKLMDGATVCMCVFGSKINVNFTFIHKEFTMKMYPQYLPSTTTVPLVPEVPYWLVTLHTHTAWSSTVTFVMSRSPVLLVENLSGDSSTLSALDQITLPVGKLKLVRHRRVALGSPADS